MKRILFGFVLSLGVTGLFAQAEVEPSEVTGAYRAELEEQYNPNSLNPIPKYEQHTKVRVWRTIDLKEKQNKGFFSNNGQITKFIIDAVQSGELTDIYASDSLTTKKDKAKFLDGLIRTQGTQYPAWDPTASYFSGDYVSYNGRNYNALENTTGKNPETSTLEWAVTTAGAAVPYLPADITVLRMVEDIIFDKRRSRLYYDIQAIQLIVPGANTDVGYDQELGWFKYKDLERIFRNHPEKAVWFNRQNTAQNKNFADAFLLRLFHSTIRKVENPDNETIFDTYAGNGRPYQEGVWATEWAEMQLMEREHNLWEF
ncbi:MAG TPA: gliding motility protein GldN [Chryseosolibacter sp.]|nr:gliding motility protein GldN [Chryseosolibacter sp.]